MDERGQVYELDDYGQINVSSSNPASRSAAKQSKKRPETFAATSNRISDVTFNRGVERSRLVRDLRFDFIELALHESRDPGNRPIGNDGCSCW